MLRERLGQLLVQLFLLLLVFLLDLLGLALRLGGRDASARADFLAGGDLHVHDDAVGAGGNGQRSVLHVRGLLAEDGAQQALFGREFRLALGRDLADEDVAGLHFRADADDAVGAEVAAALPRETFGMSRVISSGPSLVSRAPISNSSIWIEV